MNARRRHKAGRRDWSWTDSVLVVVSVALSVVAGIGLGWVVLRTVGVVP